MVQKEFFLDSLIKLERYVKIHNYSGYDPYDALILDKLKSLHSKLLKLFATQLLVYSPINYRVFLNMQSDRNPKAIGLFLSSYCRLYKIGLINKHDFDILISNFVDYLLNQSSVGYSGYCWGFNFDWQDLTRYSKKGLPTIVITSYIGHSFLDLYEITGEKRYLQIANNVCNFLLKDLHNTKTREGICFSYTPIDNFIVHNANCLGAGFLSRVYSFTKEKELLDYSRKAFDFSLSFQKKDGSWAYSFDSGKKTERNQIDFHQGFILDSLIDFLTYSGENNYSYMESLEKGISFYVTYQFQKDGSSIWRLPWRFPVDIHNQSQGIITLCKYFSYSKKIEYLEIAQHIAEWTIENMQDKTGYFYYQKWPLFYNKISYMRWSQAWMMFALSLLLLLMEDTSNENDS